MHEILHIIGVCPDSLAHVDLLDIFISNYQTSINLINRGYETIKNIL
jgi:hypothetical protein